MNKGENIMKCLDNEIIFNFINNNVSEKEKKIIKSHFSDCSHCREIYEKASLYIEENEYLEFEPVSLDFAQSVIREISPEISNDDNFSLNNAKQELISKFAKHVDNIKELSNKLGLIIHEWIQQTLSLPLPVQQQLSLVPIRGETTSTIPVYDSIEIRKTFPDTTIDICLIKDTNDNTFHILAKNADFKQGKSLKRLYLYNNINPIKSNHLKEKYQYFKKHPAGTYKFEIDSNAFELEISDEFIYEK